MKAFLISYDTNFNTGKSLMILIHAYTFEEAKDKLLKSLNACDRCDKVTLVRCINLTIL